MKSAADRAIFQHSSWSEQPPIGSPIAFIMTLDYAIDQDQWHRGTCGSSRDVTIAACRSPRIARRCRSRAGIRVSLSCGQLDCLALLPFNIEDFDLEIWEAPL